MQVNEYGQTPKQVFTSPHPKRFSAIVNEILLSEECEKIKLIEELQDNNTDKYIENSNKISVEEIEKSILEQNSTDNIREAFYNFDRSYFPMLKFHKK
jgi:hypothetical protein